MSLMNKFKPKNQKQRLLISGLDSKDVNIIGIFTPQGTEAKIITLLYCLSTLSDKKYKKFNYVSMHKKDPETITNDLFTIIKNYSQREELCAII